MNKYQIAVYFKNKFICFLLKKQADERLWFHARESAEDYLYYMNLDEKEYWVGKNNPYSYIIKEVNEPLAE